MYNQNEEQEIEAGQETSQRVDSTPPPGSNPFIRAMSSEEMETVNSIIREAEKITDSLKGAWIIRNQLRRVIADLVCPWPVGTVLMLNEGKGAMDRRVVTAVLPGKTEDGEFYKVRYRILKRGVKLGEKEFNLKLTPELQFTVMGMFEGVMPVRDEGKDLEGMEV